MTRDQELNRKVAELCGWKLVGVRPDNVEHWKSPDGRDRYRANFIEECFPNYCEDQNAINAAVLGLSDTPVFVEKDGMNQTERGLYICALERVVFRDNAGREDRCYFELLNATARQKCEAYTEANGKLG